MSKLRKAERDFAALPCVGNAPHVSFDAAVWEHQMKISLLDVVAPEEFKWTVNSLEEGFDTLVPPDATVRTATRNLPVSGADKIALTRWVSKSVAEGWTVGPADSADQLEEAVSGIPINRIPIGCVPKPGSADKIRAIVHASWPRDGDSVNAAILDEHKRVHYVGLRAMCKMAREAGEDGSVWVADQSDAYLWCRMRPEQRHWYGFEWLGRLLVFCCLFFGLASAPQIYSRFADVIEHMVCFACDEQSTLAARAASKEAFQWIRHYLDDFFGFARTEERANRQFDALVRIWKALGIRVRQSKLFAPAKVAKIVGFIFDLPRQMLRLPKDKVVRYVACVDKLLSGRTALTREVASLVGKVRWCASCVFGVQATVRELELSVVSARRANRKSMNINSRHRTCLKLCRAMLLRAKRGVPFSYIIRDAAAATDHSIWTDASETLGLGGVSSIGVAYQLRWANVWPGAYSVEINRGELIAMWLLFRHCAAAYANSTVSLFVDNRSTASWLRKKSAKCPAVMWFVTDIVRLAFEHNILFWVYWLPSAENKRADDLSRFSSEEWPVDGWHDQCALVAPLLHILRSVQLRTLMSDYINRERSTAHYDGSLV